MDARPARRLSDNFWDLRDEPYDHPARWEGITAVDVFQHLAECIEAVEVQGEPVNWVEVSKMMVVWRAGATNASGASGGPGTLAEQPVEQPPA